MNITELASILFEDAPGFTIYDHAGEIVVDSIEDLYEDALLLNMPDAYLDLCIRSECFAVASDEVPLELACITGSKGDRVFGVFILDPTENIDSIPDWLATEIPVGVGWEYVAKDEDVLVSLDDIVAARVSAAADEEDIEDAEIVEEPVEEAEIVEEPVEEAEIVEETSVQRMNDAILVGEPHEEMDTLLEKDATLMLGRLYGKKDRRNTQDGEWKETTMSWLAWLEGRENGKNTWGFSRHPESKFKEGPAFVPAKSIDGARTDGAIKTMYAIVLDVDSGVKYDDTLRRLEELGVFAIMYTSFNHGKDKLILKHDDIVRKMRLDGSPTRIQIQEYLREHHKDRFDENFINTIEIEDLRAQTKDGLRTVLRTQKLDKFRIIIPLWEPVELSELGATVNQWKTVWADAVTGFGVNSLGITFDATSSDVNRLFYTPRHPKGGEWRSNIVMGRPLRFEEIEPYSKDAYIRERSPGDPFAAGVDLVGDTRPELFTSPSGADLNAWHKNHKTRFLITDVLESFAEDRIRVAGGEAAGTCHIECPFEDEHSEPGGTATMAMNPDENENGYWTVFCHHDTCRGRHKLEFLNEMLTQNWFEESVLWDEEYNIPLPDDEIENEEEASTENEEPTTPRTPQEIAASFTSETTAEELRKFMRKLIKKNIDVVESTHIRRILKDSTTLGARAIASLWAEAQRAVAEARAAREDTPVATIPQIDWDFSEQLKWTRKRIAEVNEERPRVFHYIQDVARITEDSKHRPIIKILCEKGFASLIDDFTVWHEVRTVGDVERRREVPTPRKVVEKLYYDDHPYPSLRGLVSTPTFVYGGDLLTTPGFHHESGLYYWNDGVLDVPPVPDTPTDDNVYEAKRILIEEVFGDFPLGGLHRDEIMEQALNGPGVPAVTHIILTLLLMFCRDMIDGPTPGHLIQKPSPGTGASLLADIISMVAFGKPASAQQLPTNAEEMQKSLLTVIRDGESMIYFDNIDQNVDSGVFASYLTAREVSGRVLGRTQSVTAEVRAVWLLCGNNVKLSNELLRRLLLIDIDANMANPEKRTGFRHDNIVRYIEQNRGEIVWACLTLIQNWVAKGMKPQTNVILNSFEDWSYIMGGIARDAGLGGFMENRDKLMATASDGSEDDIIQLLDVWWAFHMNKKILLHSADVDEPSVIRMAVENDVQIPLKMRRGPDEELTYDSRQFAKYMGRYEGRVMRLTDETEVKIVKDMNRSKKGYYWRLEPVGGS